MNILIEIGHPAHVHFFAQSIHQLEALGHCPIVVTRNKEITDALLDRAGIAYRSLSTPASGKLGLLKELVGRWREIASVIRSEKVDLAVSISGISTSLPSRWRGIPNLNFTDTEDATLSNWIAFPFSDAILTPRFFLKDLGRKHRRYAGLHELAYLQHYDPVAGAATRRRLGLPERYSIVRTVACDAVHDWKIRGVSEEELSTLLQRLETAGPVFLTSQKPLRGALSRYKLEAPIEDIHAVLAGAQIFIGESPTMAVESGLLGVPAFLVSGRVGELGNMVCLEKEFQLLRNFMSWGELFSSLPGVSELPNLKREWGVRAARFLQDMPSMSDFILQTMLKAGAGCAG